jgi:hypothetical protein
MKTSNIGRRQVRQVLLFSGHMIDTLDRPNPRFPPSAEAPANAAIVAALDGLEVGPEDLGITEGACGGDLLFSEAMIARGATLELRFPFHERQFIEQSVAYPKKTPPSDCWLERFRAVRNHVRVCVRAIPDEHALLPESDDPYEQCNLWMLRDALSFGGNRVRFLCLWNGAAGKGPGGTAHMTESITNAGGKAIWLDTRELWET